MEGREVVIVSAVRTPIGRFMGGLATVDSPELGALVIAEAVRRAGVNPKAVEKVIMGSILTAGVGQGPARQAAIKAGIPARAGCTTINKLCGSGLKAVMYGAQAVAMGDADIVVAGGMENMSQAPYVSSQLRRYFRMTDKTLGDLFDHMIRECGLERLDDALTNIALSGDVELAASLAEHFRRYGERVKFSDSMIRDGLWDPYYNWHMGNAAELCARRCKFSREDQDEYAKLSYTRALEAQAREWFRDEIDPVLVVNSAGKVIVDVSEDEEPKRFDPDKVAEMRPAFQKDGTVTAVNASSLNDGASAVVLMDADTARDMGIRPMARIVGYASYAQDPRWFTTAPARSVEKLFDRVNKIKYNKQSVDLYEINEAFSVVSLVNIRDLKLDIERVNVAGGAVALGHPVGASGARILTTLLYQLKRTGGHRGITSLCIGGGEAVAMMVEMI